MGSVLLMFRLIPEEVYWIALGVVLAVVPMVLCFIVLRNERRR